MRKFGAGVGGGCGCRCGGWGGVVRNPKSDMLLGGILDIYSNGTVAYLHVYIIYSVAYSLCSNENSLLSVQIARYGI